MISSEYNPWIIIIVVIIFIIIIIIIIIIKKKKNKFINKSVDVHHVTLALK